MILLRTLCSVAALSLAGWVLPQARAATGPAEVKSPLRVGYFGKPESARSKDFLTFLEEHFARVGCGELDKFQPKDGESYDVVILDYDEVKIVKNRIQMPNLPFDKQYRRPTMTLGATGALISERLGLKTGYL